MARILIAWELGAGIGHLARCLQLARGLGQRGHSVVLALKDVRLPGGPEMPRGITILPAPLTPQLRQAARPLVNYADILCHCGFAEAPDLAARLVAWQGILALARPTVLIGDHAPTALLAARLSGIPHMAIGNGFAIPPAVFPWPSIRPWETVADEDLTVAEERLDRTTAAAQKRLGYSTTVRMRELFGDRDVLDTFAELDHYGERPNGRYVGPIISVPHALPVDWQSREGSRVLAYLRPETPGFTTILQAFARLDAEVLCIAPGLAPIMAKRLATRRLRLALTPVDLPPLLAKADLAVNYGNSGFSTQALLAGVPLLMSPRHVEQRLFAHRIEALGAGELFNPHADVEAATNHLQALLHSISHRQAAQAFASGYRRFSPEDALDQSLGSVEQMLPGVNGARQERPSLAVQESPLVCFP